MIDLIDDLETINHWAFQQKMKFNPDRNKQGQEITFSWEENASLHPMIHFNNKPNNSNKIHKDLGIVLDSRLRYEDHIKSVLSKVNKTIGLL